MFLDLSDSIYLVAARTANIESSPAVDIFCIINEVRILQIATIGDQGYN